MTKNVNDNNDSLAALRGQVGERQNHGCGPNPLLALGISVIVNVFIIITHQQNITVTLTILTAR